MGSNYDRLQSTIVPRTRAASEAFGIDSRTQTTPNLRRHPSQLSNGPIYEDEPDYCSMLEDTIMTPNNLQTETRPHSSGFSTGAEILDPVATSNMINMIGAQFGLTDTQISPIEIVIQQPDDQRRQIAMMCFLTSEFHKIRQAIADNQRIVPTAPQHKDRSECSPDWRGEDSVRDFIRDDIKEHLMKSKIQAYTTVFSVRSEPVLASLENLIIEDLLDSKCKVPVHQLPVGF